MTRVGSLLAEFAHEVKTVRKHLERLPDHQLEWRPHVKSRLLEVPVPGSYGPTADDGRG